MASIMTEGDVRSAVAVRQAASRLLGALIVRVGGSAAGFAATILVTAALGAADAGFLFGTLIWANTVAVVARWGGTDRILLDVPPRSSPGRRPALAGYVNRILVTAVMRSAILSSGLALTIAAVRALGLHPVLSLGFLLALTPATAALQLLSAATKAMGRQTLAIGFEFALVPLAAILVWALDRSGSMTISFWAYAAVYAGGTLLAAAACFAIALSPFWNLRLARKPRLQERRRSRDFALVELATVTNGGIGLLGLPLLMTAADVGIFNVVFRVAAVIHLASSTIQVILLPKLSLTRRKSDRAAFLSALKEARTVMAAIGVAFIPFVYLAGPVVMRAAGPEFVAGIVPLYLIAGLFALGTMTGPNTEVLSALGRQDITRRVALTVSVVTLVLLLPAARLAGLQGAAFVTGAGFLAQKLATWFYERSALRSLRWKA